LGHEGDQAIRSALCADLQVDDVRDTLPTDDKVGRVLRVALNRPPVSFEDVAEESFGPQVALGASSGVGPQYPSPLPWPW
jgi:hypothetical protein